MDQPLLEHRAAFPALEEAVWLCSHTLGCLPAGAADDLGEFLSPWQTQGPGAWDEWLPLIDRIAADVERLLSAPRGTVTLLTNVSQVMATIASCFEYPADRPGIVYSATEFPSVSYVWQGEVRRGARVTVVP